MGIHCQEAPGSVSTVSVPGISGSWKSRFGRFLEIPVLGNFGSGGSCKFQFLDIPVQPFPRIPVYLPSDVVLLKSRGEDCRHPRRGVFFPEK